MKVGNQGDMGINSMKITKKIKLMTAAIVAVILGATLFAGAANAQKVGNPGPINFGAVGGYMKFGILDPFNLEVDPLDPTSTITLNGSVDQNGVITIPQSSQEFPTFTLEDIAVVGDVDIKINSVGTIVGSVNPYTGATFVPVRLWIKVNSSSSLIGSGCALASASNPLVIDLTSGTSTPVPASAGPAITGVPYNAETGLVTLVDGKVAAPASNGCGLAAGQLDGMIGLPSGSGKNQISFQMKLTPTVTKGVTARFTMPSHSFIDEPAELSAATSSVAKLPATYRWDFNNDGTFDTPSSASPTVSHTFATPGNHSVRLRVTDPDGDSDEIVKQIQAVRHSDLEIVKSQVGQFEVGTNPIYRLSVENHSPDVAPFGTTVTDTVPAEFPVQSVDAPGWNCGVVGQTVTCDRQQIAGNSTADPIDIRVGVTGEALPYKFNTATVATPGDPDPSNNTDTVRTDVFAVDLIIDKSHDYEFRPGADPKNVHVINVTNRGTAPTANPTTVTDTLPAGLTPVSASGSGWNCDIAGQNVTCVNNGNIGPGDEAAPIEIASSGDIEAAGAEPGGTSAEVTNSATVSNVGDVIGSNNSDSDPTWILNTPDLRIEKSHVGNFRAGTPDDYTISVDNRGPQATTSVTTVTDTLPDSMEFISAEGTGWVCAAEEQVVTCTHDAAIDADTSAGDITLSVDPTDPGELVNVAEVDNADDPNDSNDTAEDPTSVRLIDLKIAAVQEGEFRLNRDGYYRISLENLGTSPTASDSVITSTLPAGVTYADWNGEGWTCAGSSGSNVSCSYSDPIAAGESPADLILGVSFFDDSMPDNTVDFHVATDDDYVAENNDAAVTGDVFAMDSSIALSHNGSFRAGVTRTYNVAVKNVGSADSVPNTTSAVIELADGLTYSGSTGSGWSCTADGQEVTCEYAPTIAAEGNAAVLGIQVSVSAEASPSATTGATVTTTGDRNADNDSAESVTPVASPDLGVASSHTGNFRVGTQNSFTLLARNDGDAQTIQPIQVTDTIPAGLSFVSATGSGWSCNSSALPNVVCTHTGAVNAGSSAPPITVKVMPTVAAVPAATNVAAISGAPDFNSANDSSSDEVTVTRIDVTGNLAGATDAVEVGDDLTYVATVSNPGSAATIAPIVVVGTLPDGVIASEVSGGGWNCQVDGQDISCARAASLPAGETAPSISIQTLIKPSADENIDFDFTTGTVDDVNLSNNASNTIVTPIVAGPDGTVTLRAAIPANLENLRVGSNGVYHVTAHNEGGLPTEVGSKVVVELPEGLDPGFSGSNDWPCYVVDRTITCTYVPAIPAKQSTPSFPINFTVDSSADEEVTAEAHIEVAGDLDHSNDGTADEQVVTRTDVGVALTQSGQWVKGSTGAYAVNVSNPGTGKTVGPIKVSTKLPAGSTYKSASGQGWNCSPSGVSVTCVRQAILNAGAAAPPIAITSDIGEASANKADATATVITADDTNAANDSATASMTIGDKPLDPKVSKAVLVASTSAKMNRNGTIPVSLSCPADATEKCAGSAWLTTNGKLKMGKAKKAKKKKLSTGKVSYSIAPGQTFPVMLKFTGKAKKAVAAKRSVKTTVSAMPTTSDLATSKGKLTLKTR